jgi:hypothetical protein
MASIFTRQRVAYYCTVLLIAAFAVQVLSVVKDREIGGDFMTLYAAGRVSLNYPHTQLYNLDIQETEYRKVAGPRGYSPFGYTPWFSIPLELLAHLPYAVAFGLWTLLSVLLLLVAYRLIARSEGLPSSWNNLGFLACLAFPPYLFYSLINGHPSAFALLVVVSAYVLQKKGKQVLAGMTLALLSYKPTLLVFIAPMLFFTRQWKCLMGLVIGGGILGLVGIAWVGVDANIAFLKILRLYTEAVNSRSQIFQTEKYIDLGAAIKMLVGPHAFLRPLLLALSFPVVCFLWYRNGARPISWSLAIVSGHLFNIYTPIYDCTLLIFAVIIIGVRSLDSWLVVSLYLVPLLTVPLAKVTGIQLFTIVLSAFFILLTRRTFNVLSPLSQAEL